MSEQYDFKKEWPRIKKELARVSKEAVDLAKKGEKELVKLSKQGKQQLDVAVLNLKKKHLFHKIGEEYVKAQFAEAHTPQLKKLTEELSKIDKSIEIIKKKSTAKTTKKKRKTKKSNNSQSVDSQ